eukprot:228251-Prorocentrum_minimum.AAC.2
MSSPKKTVPLPLTSKGERARMRECENGLLLRPPARARGKPTSGGAEGGGVWWSRGRRSLKSRIEG